MKERIKTKAILCGLLMMMGCQRNIPGFEKTQVTINNQQFEIVTASRLFDNYLIEHKKFGDNYTKASNNLIYEPLRMEIIENAEAPFMFETIKIPYEPNDQLRREIELLKSEELIYVVKNALMKITGALPGPNTKIILLPANPTMQQLFKKTGICMNGVTIGTGKIIIMIDPTFNNWKEYLPYVVAHEYHHSTWISRNWVSPDFSLLEYLIFEGRADMFASGLYKDIINPFTKIINKEQEEFVWNKIKNEINEKGHERINKVMYGSDGIPMGSGYAIGYHIVKSYKQNNPTYSDRGILDMDPKKIYEMSKYE